MIRRVKRQATIESPAQQLTTSCNASPGSGVDHIHPLDSIVCCGQRVGPGFSVSAAENLEESSRTRVLNMRQSGHSREVFFLRNVAADPPPIDSRQLVSFIR